MSHLRWFIPFAALGCPADPPTPGFGTLSSGYACNECNSYGYYSSYSYTSYGGSGITALRPAIVEHAAVCGPTLSSTIETSGWTSQGYLYLHDPVAGVGESHDVWSYEFAPNGDWDHLRVRLEPGSTYERSVSTGVSCDDFAEVTVAIAVDDLQGVFADCRIVGPDAVGLASGSLSPLGAPEFPLVGCPIEVVAR